MKQLRGGWSAARRWTVGLAVGGAAALTLAVFAWPLAFVSVSTIGKGSGVSPTSPEEGLTVGRARGGCVGDACDLADIHAPLPFDVDAAPTSAPAPASMRTTPVRANKSKVAVKTSTVPSLPAPFADIHLFRPKLPGKQSGNSKKEAEDEQYPPLPDGQGGYLRTSTRPT
jgi:hypothetical protein